jgi:hypothetical protein
MAEQPDVEPTTVRDRWPAGSYLCASVERWGRLGHHIEREPKSPISRGRLCPKGSDSFELLTHSKRVTRVKYRRAYSKEQEELFTAAVAAEQHLAERPAELRRDSDPGIE